MTANATNNRRRSIAVVGLLTLALLSVGAAATGDDGLPGGRPLDGVHGIVTRVQLAPDCPLVEGTFGPGNWPSACWRPYSDSSPFNRPIGPDPKIAPNSDRVVARMLGFGPLQHLLLGEAGKPRDHSHPTYWSQPDDPWFTLHCLKRWGRCQLEGERIQIPDEAMVPTGSDGHMTVVDQRTGWEYDFWQVRSKPKGGGTLTFSWGGKTKIDGEGIGVDSNAARFGEMAGLIRAEELEAAHIDHALFLFVHCDSGEYVYPATHLGRACDWIGLPNEDAPPEGALFQLDMSDGEIDALDAPPWKKAILRAMAHYGMYVGDTGGSWGLKHEGGITYTSFGYEDKFVTFAKKAGVPYSEKADRYILNIRDGIDWRNRLRMIDPCEASGTC
jgi:hypothetical protein